VQALPFTAHPAMSDTFYFVRVCFLLSLQHGRRDTDSPWKHDLYEQASKRGGQRDISSGSSITSRLGGALGSNTIKVENLHYEVTEADVNVRKYAT
jgi:hypothetical protein